MSRAAVASIAIAVMLVAAFVAVSDPTRNGQLMAMGLGLFASAVVFIGILAGVSDGSGYSRGDTSQVVNLYVEQAAPPASAAAPQIVYIPMPSQAHPAYLTHPGYAPHALPAGHETAGYLPAPPQSQFRGALDVVAEPVHELRYHPQPQVQRGPVAQLESPQASLVRRMARRLVG